MIAGTEFIAHREKIYLALNFLRIFILATRRFYLEKVNLSLRFEPVLGLVVFNEEGLASSLFGVRRAAA